MSMAPASATARVAQVARSAGGIAARLAGAGGPRREEASRYRSRALAPYAARVGLSTSSAVAIHRLRADPGVRTVVRVGRLLILPAVRSALPAAVSAALLSRALARLGRARLGRAVAAGGLLGAAWRGMRNIRIPRRSTAYLHHAARRIRAILEAEGHPVPYLVFGHSHVAESMPIGGGAGAPTYINCGSWVREPEMEERDVDRFPVVRILVRPGGAGAEAGLYLWDDRAGELRPFPSPG